MNETFYTDRNKLDSPLEEMFIQQFEKFVNGNCEIIPQFKVKTDAGEFRIDFVIKLNDLKIGIECDGRKFHDEWKDEWRDSMILGSNGVDTIYRFRGMDLTTYLNECIHVLYENDQSIFCERYSKIYINLVDVKSFNMEFSKHLLHSETIIHHIETEDEFGRKTGRHHMIRVVRRNRNIKEQYWNNLYEFSKHHPNSKIDELIELRRSQRR
jgi:hypothetical protein